MPHSESNYYLASEHLADIRATYILEVSEGMALGPFTREEAARACICQPDHL